MLDGDSPFRIAEDFTPKVRQAKRVLGQELVRARNNGQQAQMKFDKLIINNDVYKYPISGRPVVIRDLIEAKTYLRSHRCRHSRTCQVLTREQS